MAAAAGGNDDASAGRSSLEERLDSLSSRVQQLELATAAAGAAAPAAALGEGHPLLLSMCPEASAGGMGAEQLKAERDKALAQIEELQKDKARLEYRIMHLVRGLNAVEAAAALAQK